MSIKLTRYEVAVIHQIINSPGGSSTITDLRLAQKTVSVLEAVDKNEPDRPAPPGAEATNDEKTAYVEKVKEWTQLVNKMADEEIDVPLEQDCVQYVGKRVSKFPGFYTDEKSRARVLALATKLGV